MIRILCIALLLQTGFTDQCRDAYRKQDETKVMALLKQLQAKKEKSSVEQCYEGVFLCLKAGYSNNPYTKYAAFKDGYAKLNKQIRIYPNNVEYRYHRYMIETKAPSFLFDEVHTKQDKAFVIAKRNKDHPMYDMMSKI